MAGIVAQAAVSAAAAKTRWNKFSPPWVIPEYATYKTNTIDRKRPVGALTILWASGCRPTADLVRACPPAAPLAVDPRPVRAARERGDAPADPGAARRPVLRALARALSRCGVFGRRPGARRPRALVRSRLQPACFNVTESGAGRF